MFVVVVTLLTALVMLPALLGLLGDRVDALRLPVIGRLRERHAAAASCSGSAPLTASCAGRCRLAGRAGVLLAAAAPLVLMKTGNTNVGAAICPGRPR